MEDVEDTEMVEEEQPLLLQKNGLHRSNPDTLMQSVAQLYGPGVLQVSDTCYSLTINIIMAADLV